MNVIQVSRGFCCNTFIGDFNKKFRLGEQKHVQVANN